MKCGANRKVLFLPAALLFYLLSLRLCGEKTKIDFWCERAILLT